MKTRKTPKFRVRPFNIRNGATAPYFIIEPDGRAKKDEVAQLAANEFRGRSTLAKYSNWDLAIEKI